MLIDSIETLQDWFLPLTSLFEEISPLLFKNSKNSYQSNNTYIFEFSTPLLTRSTSSIALAKHGDCG